MSPESLANRTLHDPSVSQALHALKNKECALRLSCEALTRLGDPGKRGRHAQKLVSQLDDFQSALDRYRITFAEAVTKLASSQIQAPQSAESSNAGEPSESMNSRLHLVMCKLFGIAEWLRGVAHETSEADADEIGQGQGALLSDLAEEIREMRDSVGVR